MRAVYEGKGYSISHEVTELKQAFAFIGACDELFGIEKCGNCGEKEQLRPRYRETSQGYKFYSIACGNCQYELKYGQTKEGGRLFAKDWEAPYEGDGQQEARDESPAF